MQRDLIRPVKLPSVDSSFGRDFSYMSNNPLTTRFNSLPENKPSAFMLSNNVQDSYSSYRVNNNMGVAPSPSNAFKLRQGFFGETYAPAGENLLNIQRQGYNLPYSSNIGKSAFIQGGTSVVTPNNRRPSQYPGYNEASPSPSVYNQSYGQKPNFYNQRTIDSNPLLSNQKFIDVRSNVLLPPLYIGSSTMQYPRRQQSLAPQNQSHEDSMGKVEKLFLAQSRHLENLIKIFDNGETSSLGSQSARARQPDPSNFGISRRPTNRDFNALMQRMQQPSQISRHNAPLPQIPQEQDKPSVPSTLKDIPAEDKLNDSQDSVQSRKPTARRGKKKKLPFGLRQILWTFVYPALLQKEVQNTVDKRRKDEHIEVEQLTKDLSTSVAEFFQKNCGLALEALYKEGKSLLVIGDGKKLSDKDLKKNFTLLTEKISAIIQALHGAITLEKLPKPFLDFFSRVSKNRGIIPQKFLTEYEIYCLEFSCFGTLKNMTPFRCKMLTGIFLIVRGLIFTFLTQPWTVYPKHKKSSNLSKKLKSCSSVLYHVVMDIFKEKLQVAKNNQSLLRPEKRLKPLKGPLVAFDNHGDETKADPNDLEIIKGLYSKENLIECWTSQKDSVEKLKGLVEDCLEKLYSVAQEAQTQTN